MPDKRAAGGEREEESGSDAARLIAPWWHTVLVVVVVLGVSVFSRTRTTQAPGNPRRVVEYSMTLAWEWLLAACVVWGTWLRGVPLRSLLGVRRAGARAWFVDAGIAAVFWLGSTAILGGVATALKFAHLTMPEKALASLAPANALELTLFIVLSISAGFCEELLFRGYLQQQFTRMARGRVSAGIVGSSLVFGLAHLYEGASGVLLIFLFGLMFALLAERQRSLRAGMIAHAWHDSISGVALFLIKRSGKLPTH